jgi:hypothetical protein
MQFKFSLKGYLNTHSFHPIDEYLILKKCIIYGKSSVLYSYLIIIPVVLWESSDTASVFRRRRYNFMTM